MLRVEHSLGEFVKKIIGLLLLVLATAGCPNASAPNPPAINPDWTITATWSFDFTNFSPCSATVTKGCVSGFSWGYIQGTNQVPLKTSPASVCTGATQPESCSDTANSVLGIGPTIFYVKANGIDNNGAVVTSNQAQSPSQTVNLVDPANVSVTLK
jgi:hypothetical protein